MGAHANLRRFEVWCGKDAEETGETRGLLIFRPTKHPRLWDSVLQLMSVNHAMLFFDDDTTPLFWDLDSVAHFPADLIANLGTPVRVRTPEDIIRD